MIVASRYFTFPIDLRVIVVAITVSICSVMLLWILLPGFSKHFLLLQMWRNLPCRLFDFVVLLVLGVAVLYEFLLLMLDQVK